MACVADIGMRSRAFALGACLVEHPCFRADNASFRGFVEGSFVACDALTCVADIGMGSGAFALGASCIEDIGAIAFDAGFCLGIPT